MDELRPINARVAREDPDPALYWLGPDGEWWWPRAWSTEQRAMFLRRSFRKVGGLGNDVAAAAFTIGWASISGGER